MTLAKARPAQMIFITSSYTNGNVLQLVVTIQSVARRWTESIPYSGKVWRGFQFGDFADNRQIKNPPILNFYNVVLSAMRMHSR